MLLVRMEVVQPLRRGFVVLALLPGLVAVASALEWYMLNILPGLVASGGALLFGVNAWCLDGRGTLWRESLPVRPRLAFGVRVVVLLEVLWAATALALLLGSLRAGVPTTAQVVAVLCSSVVVTLQVVAGSMRWSLRRPYAVDMRSARATPAPPLTMVGYSTRLALVTTFTGMLTGRDKLAAFRDATVFKVLYGWGLRRREAAKLDTVDWSANAAAPEFGRHGALSVRFGKATRGSPPRRRTVLTTMGWAAEAVAEWMTEIRPAYRVTGNVLWPTERGGRISVEHIEAVEGMEVAVSSEDVRRAWYRGVVSVIFGLENGRPLSLPGTIDACVKMGVRYVTLTHMSSHEWCDASTDEPRHGGRGPAAGAAALAAPPQDAAARPRASPPLFRHRVKATPVPPPGEVARRSPL